jgi:predicted ATPase
MRKGLAAVRAVEQQFDLPRYLGLFADAHRLAGQTSEGLKILDDALDRAGRTGERWFDAELHRLKGGTLQATSPDAHGQAAACFRRAIEVARDQGAKLWELRATVSLARLWRTGASGAKARDLLSAALAWFTEGFDTPDLIGARALLDEYGC